MRSFHVKRGEIAQVLHLRFNKALWSITSAIALSVALIGVLRPDIYAEVTTPAILPGVFTQDLLVIFASILSLLLLFGMQEKSRVRQIVQMGIMGFFAYAYGVYSIEQIYTLVYPAYLAVFGAAVFILAYNFSCFRHATEPPVRLRKAVLLPSAVFAVVIAVMFNAIWLGQLLPLIRNGSRLDFLYSIYIIDLSFVMPAFVIAAIMALRGAQVGLAALPVLFILGAGILSPLALGELVKPIRYDAAFTASEFWLYAVLSLAFLGATTLYLAALRSGADARSDQSGAPPPGT